MEMTDLLKLYYDFFETLSKEEESFPEEIEGTSDEEIDKLASDFGLFIPEDIRSFFCSPKTVYIISRFTDNEQWVAGFDFCDIDIIRRDIPMYRDELAIIYEDDDPLKHLHLMGVPLS